MLANLKAALAVRRLRQADLAVELKISASVVSEVVCGRRELAPHLRTRAAEFLGVDEGWLFAETRALPPRREETRTEVGAVTATA